MRLIDADKLCAWLSRNATSYFTVPDIENAPAVDAVAVTRCEDCKHYARWSDGRAMNYCDRLECNMFDYDFCSYGEEGGAEKC